MFFRYDSNGRLKKTVFPHKTNIGIVNELDYIEYQTYDNNNNITTERKRNGVVITYQYDNLNRRTVKNLPGMSQDVYYGYTLSGLPTYTRFQSKDSSSQGITNTYDGFGNITSTTTKMGNTSRTLAYQYDLHNNRTRITHPDNQYFTYNFDDLNRVINLSEANNTSKLLTLSYKPTGVRDNIIRTNSSNYQAITNYAIDSAGRLAGLTQNFSGTGDDLTTQFEYTPANQISRSTITNNRYRSYTQGNLTHNYVANGLNQYDSINGSSILYDANGNLSKENNVNYSYDNENRLIAISGSKNAILVYDPLGRLHNITIDNNSTEFLYDGDALIAEYNSNGTLLKRYVHGDRVDEPLVEYTGSQITSSNRYFLHADHQGSIIAYSNNTANASNINRYDAYGIAADTNTGRFGYTGQIYLKEIGLNYYKARIYHPKLGRFLQTDPVGYEDQMNLYAYVGNDPINHRDPTGKFLDTILDVGFIIYDVGALVYDEVANGGANRTENVTALGADLAGAMIPGATGLGLVARADNAVSIVGNAQRTTKAGVDTTHASTSLRVADEMAATGEYSSIHLNQKVRTITGGDSSSLVRPDVAGIRKDNGKIDVVEVLSPGQTAAQMENKLQKALGSSCGSITCVKQD